MDVAVSRNPLQTNSRSDATNKLHTIYRSREELIKPGDESG